MSATVTAVLPPSENRRPASQAASGRVAPLPDLPVDCDADATSVEGSPNLGPRSVSLTTLQPAVIQPRMAQLETLEAKMASIEVSLSSTPRRRKLNGSVSGISLGSNRSISKELAAKELENLRNALRDKENIIQSLKGQLTVPGLRLNGIRNNNSNGNSRELSEVEKKQAEDRLNRLKTDVDNKRLAIKNLKMALEKLDITDNIDVRIQQAELEYQLGREELNLLTLLEETRALQLCIEESNKTSSELGTLYSCVHGEEYVVLRAVEVDYDPKSPKFGAGQKESCPGLWIDWALEETGLCKGDRLVEVNGKIVLTKSREDLSRLLAAAPDPAQIVILRKPTEENLVKPPPTHAAKELAALRSELEVVRDRAEEAQRAKDTLRSDNIRLTHRISYLEEQVTELLNRKPPDGGDIRIVTPSPMISKSDHNVTNINITSRDSPVSNKSDVQLFQKGPQITALVSNIPSLESKDSSLNYRSKSSLSNVSNTMIPAPSPQPDHHCYKGHRHKQNRPSRNSMGYEQNEKIVYRKHGHHHHHREKDYNSETNSAVEPVNRYNRRNHEHRYSAEFSKATSEKEFGQDNIMDQSYKKATKIVHELTRTKDNSLYEKHRQKCITASEKYNADILKHYNARKSTSVLDFRSEVHIGPKYSDSKSVEELDALESPTKPSNRIYKKIQDARSVKSLDFDSDCNSINNSRLNGHTNRKNTDYASELLDNDNKKLTCYQNYYDNHGKPRPTPPKKPLRLSLHKTHSLQSVESSNTNGELQKNETRKRNHKGEMPMCIPVKPGESCDLDSGKLSQMKWMNYRKSMENGLEQGSWC